MTCEPESGPDDTQQLEGRTPPLPLNQDIVAMIAHELRSPLAVMSNVLRVCRTSIVPTAMPAAGDVLNRQVKKALRLVNDLMDLSRMSEERLNVDSAPVDLRSVVLNAAQDLEQAFRARRQMLALELAPEPLSVQGDGARLEQVVANMLENSSKYSPDGTRIAVMLSREEGQAVLRVLDEGNGISSDDLPHIFEPYFRSYHSARRGSGLGLGLTLTKRLVQLHGGTIEAKSRGLGYGSEFTVRLPASAGAG